jgi:ABC-2 type transport system ATP-binding protein
VTDDGALRTDADSTRVGRVALESGVALTELRTADGGLEEIFLQLTGDETEADGNQVAEKGGQE